MERIGLIGPPDRPEIERLSLRLEERGAQPVLLDCRKDPAIILSPGRVSACGEDLSNLRGVYVADLGIPPVSSGHPGGPPGMTDRRRLLDRSRRRLAVWNALLDHLARRMPVVNPPAAHDLHALKPFEVAVYERAGLPVPATVASTDPAELATLPEGARGGFLTKGMVGGYRHTERIERPRSAEEAAHLLEGGPVMVQETIEGDNVRAFVLGADLLGAAEIVPIAGGEIDSRRGESRIRSVALPPDAARSALAAAARWGMFFSAVDFMRESGSGRHVLLECNSSPFFVNFERRTGLDISGRLADFLLARPGARRGTPRL